MHTETKRIFIALLMVHSPSYDKSYLEVLLPIVQITSCLTGSVNVCNREDKVSCFPIAACLTSLS